MIGNSPWVTDLQIIGVFAIGFVAFALGAAVGFLHRSYAGDEIPFYAPIIVGLGAVGLWLNTASALIMFIAGVGEEAAEPVVLSQIELNILTAIVGGIAAYAGGRTGDHIAPSVQVMANSRPARTDMSTMVSTVGRVIRVTIPEQIGTIDGHDPVTNETKTRLAGEEFVFPRGLTVYALRERIITRLREDYYVGYVDLELNEDGVITYLALGRRIAGIGPTLPPNRVAIAITANPPPAASPGDVVQLWELPPEAAAEEEIAKGPDLPDPDVAEDTLPVILEENPERWYRPRSDRYAFAVRTPDGNRRYTTTAEGAAELIARLYQSEESPALPRLITSGELRAKAGDVATVSIEREAVDEIDQSRDYRLVTVPASKQPEHEFAELLRTANERMETIEIGEQAVLVGMPIGALRPSIVSVRSRTGEITTLPARTYRLQPGDQLYAIGTPDQLRKLMAATTD